MNFQKFVVSTLIIVELISTQQIQNLNELSIDEEMPIGSFVTSLTDKIANLDQSIEYDLVKPLSSDWDLFSINHRQHSLVVKNRIDYEKLCSKRDEICSISVSIAVANADTIDVYLLPIRILNINDNKLRFPVNRTVIEIEENDRRWFEKSYVLPRAIDDDGDSISYSLYLQNWRKPTNLFEFDEFHLRLKPLKSFDREEENVYLLRLVAHSDEDLALDVIVVIKDENDHRPSCQSNRTIFVIENISNSSTFQLNATDLDEGENGRLTFISTNFPPGFSIDRSTGEIRFEGKTWRRSTRSFLVVNVTDNGLKRRLSTECFVEIRLTKFFQIDFQSDRFLSNTTQIYLPVENLRETIGNFRVFDQFEQKICSDCRINFTSNSFDDIFRFNSTNFDLIFNETSKILMKILTSNFHLKENLPVDLTVTVFHVDFPSIVSSKTFEFLLHFDKEKLLKKFRQFFLRLNENVSLFHRISLSKLDEICNSSFPTRLVDPTETFDVDRFSNLIVKKILRVENANFYHLKIEKLCSIDLFVYVVDPFSSFDVFPHGNESFVTISSRNLSEFSLRRSSSFVKFFSSVDELVAVDQFNASLRIVSPTLRTFSFYDFQIEIRDERTTSLSSTIAVRIFFVINENSPQLVRNETQRTIETNFDTSNFLFQINAYDPDLLLIDQTQIFPPSLEFQIENNENLFVERFSGRIFLRSNVEHQLNFTLIVTDFGFPRRLSSRFPLTLNLKSNKNEISIPMVLLGTSIVVILTTFIGLILILIVCFCCCCFQRVKNDGKTQTNWTNVSPHTPDTRLIDHEYIATSLTRASSREQRIYPIVLSHSSLNQPCLSMNDINKYLERFEKIYNESTSEQNLHQPIGSVV